MKQKENDNLSTRPALAAALMPIPQSPASIGKDLVSINDLGPKGVRAILDLAARCKLRPADFRTALAGKQVALFFEKPSLRTRLTFEAGIQSMGGASFFFDQTHSRLDAREKLSDIAHNLERWIDGIVLRTFDHTTVTGMAEHASIPVVNGLSDLEHPCQALADFLTLQERFGGAKGLTLAYVGDGNNVAHSLLLTAACLGTNIRVATPASHRPLKQFVSEARRIARKTGAEIMVTTDPHAAVAGADAVYADVWASMGQESEAAARRAIFMPYQVNDALFSLAAPEAIFMHCLPAHRGDEVTDSVIDHKRSVVFDQAENRLHVQKAVLIRLLDGTMQRFFPRSANA